MLEAKEIEKVFVLVLENAEISQPVCPRILDTLKSPTRPDQLDSFKPEILNKTYPRQFVMT